MTEREQEVIELAIRLEEAKYSVEEALLRQQFKRAVRLVMKERREVKAKNVNKTDVIRLSPDERRD